MTLKLGVIMDPIDQIKPYKDTTFALMLEAQARGHSVHYIEMPWLFLRNGRAMTLANPVRVRDNNDDWFTLGEQQELSLKGFDIILMRKDPPFDMDYVHSTYLLDMAEKEGVFVVNRPQSLRDCNEKLFAQEFPQCCPPTLVSCNETLLKSFINEQQDTIVKPLDGMGGSRIFRVTKDSNNMSVVIEVMTEQGQTQIMVQRYIPEIVEGDKRIILVNGEPIPYALARIPLSGETRGNLAAGGRGQGRELTDRDRWICQQVGPELVKRGLYIVGIDVIGDYLTEINVTSPTCIRELDQQFGLKIAGQVFDALEQEYAKRKEGIN
ncbi:MAG: glutathione synthase [Pseudomonadota bacterium]|nr:glutathione synthase [Pseudomonadota bacterium]